MLKMNWTLSAALMAAALVSTAPKAAAQTPGYRGNFTLPFEARFGDVILQPGKYAVATVAGARGIRITGDSQNVSLLAAGSDQMPDTKNGKLIFAETDGGYALQTFESGSMGRSLHFVVKTGAKGSRMNTESAAIKKTIVVGLQ